ncbi:7TM diverse intracellular signaling domain-containing protein [Algoriphagus chordae]|uniref:histidine kinase n=1 Tax=Algoriphagus chordae TaxID=237019 RepID=A0A2W7S553_9BACT|nr:7TM diverse intracellular signaling domain-containing protein [Algoriphagus chordae]PZX58125.1 phospho-acceptor domain-containing protein [Algoriphagus chordae]
MMLNIPQFIKIRQQGFSILMLVLLSFLASQPSFAQAGDGQVPVGDHEAYWVRDHATMLRTPEGSTAAEVLQRKAEFKDFDLSLITIDPDGETDYWFYFELKSEVSQLFLSIPQLFISKIELYKIEGNQPRLLSKGGTDSFDKERYLKYPGELFDMEVQKAESASYLLRINRVLYKTLSARVISGKKLISLQQRNFTAEGILLGIILGVIIYHILIFIRVKEREYLLLSIYMIFLIALIASISGASYGILSFSDPSWNYKLFNILGPFTSIFSLWFSIVFLGIKKDKNPRYWKIYTAFQILYIFAILFSLFSVPFLERTSYFLSAPTSIFLLYLGFRRYKDGFKPAAIYLAAYIPASISVIILSLYIYGLLEYYWVIHNSLLIGVVLQAIFFSLAVATKIRILIEEKESILKAENTNLEDKVRKRTIDLERSLNELRTMQAQLVQAEKMASLGELTAGIAHEIQNPLNFVNNFSEVSTEMIQEIEEERAKDKAAIDEGLISEILADIKENLSKINRHGKRADSIVKGMLEHSRTNSGEKLPTDINGLADEFIRLSFHGLRAKDKSFNANFKLDLDPDLPKINVIPQDIGRVLLNLINNAFYACAERSQTAVREKIDDYNPEVIVSTQVARSSIIIEVKDNGSGIPDSIKEKIFNPFFTTKPSGSGTGLGLSMSYDIVKAHGGEIKVDSIAGHGSTFTITLPMSK